MDPLNTPATARSESVLEDLLDSYEHAFGWARRRPAWQALPLLLGLILAPFAVVGAAVTGVVWLLGSLLDLATTGAGWLGEHIVLLAETVWHSAPIELFVAPIGHWLEQHAAGLAVPADVLALCWGLGGAVLFGLAVLTAARGAQLGWLGFGIATTAMAYAGAEPVHAPVVAGAVGLLWALGSVFALRRR